MLETIPAEKAPPAAAYGRYLAVLEVRSQCDMHALMLCYRAQIQELLPYAGFP